MGVSMNGIWVIVALLLGFGLGLFGGFDLTSYQYNHRIDICDSNNFTYQKCGELYGWDLK